MPPGHPKKRFMINLIRSGAGNSGTIGEVLNDSNCLTNEGRKSLSTTVTCCIGVTGSGPPGSRRGRGPGPGRVTAAISTRRCCFCFACGSIFCWQGTVLLVLGLKLPPAREIALRQIAGLPYRADELELVIKRLTVGLATVSCPELNFSGDALGAPKSLREEGKGGDIVGWMRGKEREESVHVPAIESRHCSFTTF
eukprot:767858-Hanusia_phi.AAC.6